MTRIRLAISTCPNDTFAFHGLLERRVDWRGIQFETELLDIQELNSGLSEGRFDVAKNSFFAALKMSDRYVVLPSGSAIGFGVGPLLLSAKDSRPPENSAGLRSLVLCPGEDTTANFLYQLFYPEVGRIEHVAFSEIMPRLRAGTADFGVCIHEGRFTWASFGLQLVEDLGTRWERETGSPLPLGGILASKTLPQELIGRVQAVIRSSLEYGQDHKTETQGTMRKWAQELNDEVLWQHVQLYVNRWTYELGVEGRQAISRMQQLARRVGVVQNTLPSLEVFHP